MNTVTFVQPVVIKFRISCTDSLMDMKQDLIKANDFLNGFLVNGITYAVSQKQIEDNRFGFTIITISVRVPMTNYNFEDRIRNGLTSILGRWGKL